MGNQNESIPLESNSDGINIFISGRGVSANDSASKAKARQKAKEHRDDVIITPAIPQEQIRKEQRKKLRVAAYCRVSTPNEAQVSSIENQIEYFQKMVEEHDDWILVGVFADEGISGTNRKKRKSLNAMIDKAMNGEIDYIVIKDVARFARNTVDALSIARDLRSLDPPVGIYFDTLNRDTLADDWETLLTVLAMSSQLESQTKSAAMLWSYKHRFEAGRLLCPTYYLLGYTTTEDGEIAIVEDEAQIIRLMYSMLITGYSPKEIAEIMTEAKVHTGWHSIDAVGNTVYNTHWTASSVCAVLRNEKYMGAVRGQKTYTLDYIEHKKRKNKGKYPTYYVEKHHAPIVTKEVWELSQKILRVSSALGRGKICRDPLKVIRKGLLCGFVPLNNVHAGYDLWDYFEASDDAVWTEETKEVEITGPLSFEILHFEFSTNQASFQMSIGKSHLNFNMECIRFMDTEYVEILFHPSEHLVAIRPSSADNPNALRWAFRENGKLIHKNPDAGIIPSILFNLMNWNADWKFRATGVGRKRDDAVLIFDLSDTEAYIPKMQYEESGESHQEGWLHPVFPKNWEGTMGNTFLDNLTKCRMHLCDYFDVWDICAEADPTRISDNTEISAEEVRAEVRGLRERAAS